MHVKHPLHLNAVQKLHLDVQMGENAIDPTAERAKDNMVVMESSLRHLIDQIMYIMRQQEYQRVGLLYLYISHVLTPGWNNVLCHFYFYFLGVEGQETQGRGE